MSDLVERSEPYLVIDASIDYAPYYKRPYDEPRLSSSAQEDEREYPEPTRAPERPRAYTPHVESDFDSVDPDPDILDKSPLGEDAKEIARQLATLQQMANRIGTAAQDMSRQLRGLITAANALAAARGTSPHVSTALTPATHAAQIKPRFAMPDNREYDGITLTDEQAARLWRKVVRTPDHWVWAGMRHKQSLRPMVRIGSKTYYAHRVVYTLHTGRDLAGEYLKQFCGEAACVRPDHHRPASHPAAPPKYDDPYHLPEDDIKVMLPEVTIHTTAAGRPRLCRKGHVMSVQPNGRAACRVCDRVRHGSKNQTDMIAVLAERSKTRAASTDISEQLDYELGIFDRDTSDSTLPPSVLPELRENEAFETFLEREYSDPEISLDALFEAQLVPEPEPIDPMSRLRARGMTVVPAPE